MYTRVGCHPELVSGSSFTVIPAKAGIYLNRFRIKCGMTTIRNMDNCIFCKIVAGEIPSYNVYEDEKYLGFFDITPRNPGHSLLIPKKHYWWTIEVPDFGEYFETAKKLGLAIQKIVEPRYISFQTFGVLVPHAHIHIVPYFELSENFPPRQKLDPEKATTLAKKIKGAL